MLPSFEIENFRTFSKLRIDHLGGVNLIVGRNNVGKTMLLEALRLYGSGGDLRAVVRLLVNRDEWLRERELVRKRGDFQDLVAPLFHGRSIPRGPTGGALLGSGGEDAGAVRIRVNFVRRIASQNGNDVEYNKIVTTTTPPPGSVGVFPAICVQVGELPSQSLPLDLDPLSVHGIESVPEQGWPAFVSALGIDTRTLARQWDVIAPYPAKEKEVLDSLGIIEEVEKITTAEDPMAFGTRMLLARIKGEAEPVPFKSLGDGMLRILQLALALQAARPDQAAIPPAHGSPDALESTRTAPVPMLLVNEVENGVHYSVLPNVWRFVFRAARVHNVQVFATTHSWDCVEAFQQAVAEETETEGVLIRLEKRGDHHKAVTFSKDELAIVTRERIEVR